jgi:hypothetical protein
MAALTPELAEQIAGRYAAKTVEAVRAYEREKRTFAEVQQAYTSRWDRITGRLRARGDYRLTDAAAMAPWYRDEAQMYAESVQALIAYADNRRAAIERATSGREMAGVVS